MSPALPLPPPELINAEDFVEAVFRGVLRAIEAQEAATVTKAGIATPLGIQRPGSIIRPGHIVYGVVYFPDEPEMQTPQSSSAATGSE